MEKKKRGRKPKGGKIIKTKNITASEKDVTVPNIILHLSCKLNDIKSTYNSITPFSMDDINKHTEKVLDKVTKKQTACSKSYIWSKIEMLKSNLHSNDISKNSNCFWCTCSFDTTPVYIPIKHRTSTIEVYGCFCSPQCATAFLFNEPLDQSTKWERYSLLNTIYSDNKKNIKPAPNPHYLLNKFYGNLTIEEYRELIKGENTYTIIKKPITKIFPELHEENSDNVVTSNTYKEYNIHDSFGLV